MEQFCAVKIGVVRRDQSGVRIEVEEAFRPGLSGLEAASWVQVVWWFSHCDDAASRRVLQEPSPYKDGPEQLGVFATRSPRRPSPIALSCAQITDVDPAAGVVGLAWVDADDGTPVLDIKPYMPSFDRVETPQMPQWCAQWPASVEASGDFDWQSVFD